MTTYFVTVTEMSGSASVTSEVQVKQLEAKVLAQTKQIEHSTEIARENEATALRLADQNKVLKDEIRRLEKNQVRIDALCCNCGVVTKQCVLQHKSGTGVAKRGADLQRYLSKSSH